MQSDIQRAALRKLAQLMENDQLSPESRSTLQNRLLKGCSELKKRINGESTENVTVVCPESAGCSWLTIFSYEMNTIQYWLCRIFNLTVQPRWMCTILSRRLFWYLRQQDSLSLVILEVCSILEENTNYMWYRPWRDTKSSVWLLADQNSTPDRMFNSASQCTKPSASIRVPRQSSTGFRGCYCPWRYTTKLNQLTSQMSKHYWPPSCPW